jgi:hypothetical protein
LRPNSDSCVAPTTSDSLDPREYRTHAGHGVAGLASSVAGLFGGVTERLGVMNRRIESFPSGAFSLGGLQLADKEGGRHEFRANSATTSAYQVDDSP